MGICGKFKKTVKMHINKHLSVHTSKRDVFCVVFWFLALPFFLLRGKTMGMNLEVLQSNSSL